MSGISSMNQPLREKIAALEEANRPLDAHWNHRSKYRLDPRDSDGKYKHHISNLEEIYNAQRQQGPAPHHFHVELPVTTLYGIRGLLSTLPGVEDKRKRREDEWVSNHQKYAVLADPTMIDYDRLPPKDSTPLGMKRSASNYELEQARSKSRSPTKGKYVYDNTNNSTAPMHTTVAATTMGTSAGHAAVSNFPTSSNSNQVLTTGANIKSAAATISSSSTRCFNEDYTEQDLILLDMYRLDTRQEEAYNAFVHMLSEFDPHDARKIVEDAMRDAKKDELLEFYGGTELPSDDADEE